MHVIPSSCGHVPRGRPGRLPSNWTEIAASMTGVTTVSGLRGRLAVDWWLNLGGWKRLNKALPYRAARRCGAVRKGMDEVESPNCACIPMTPRSETTAAATR